ncbi:hypothetical protein KAR91_29180 [Candidatus Pacearchaeota archaeon]|nr:hypothetical protein [Candidatus Pacearchaeota archaeon]
MSVYIQEGCIFQEAEMIKTGPGKARFRMTLQTVDEVNQNHRLYPRDVLTDGMENCKERMGRGAFFGEMDHPFPSGNDQFDTVRQTTVSLKEVSHIIRDYDFRGNHLVGELETSSTPNGAILHGLLKDQAGLGMSMRGLAELERLEDHNVVKDPLMVVTFDAVSLPSHKAAVVDFNEMKFESNMLTEQNGLVCLDGRCFLPNYFDKLIETRVIEFFKGWL